MNFFLLNILIVVNTILGFPTHVPSFPDLSNGSSIQNRISGGRPITIDEAPYMAHITIKINVFISSLCGGSIISNQWILTAAHCIKPTEIVARVGSSYRSSGGQLVKVAETFTHPDYDGTAYDSALLKLSEKLEFDKNIQPINLPNQDDKIEAGIWCFVSGWGNTWKSSFSLEQLHGVSIPIIDHQICKEQLEKHAKIGPDNICAGEEEGGKGACRGDSGGPLMYNKTIFGIVSRGGVFCSLSKSPTIFTNVAYIRNWIKEVSGL